MAGDENFVGACERSLFTAFVGLYKELTYLAWGDCAGGLGVIRFSVNPLFTRLISLVQTIEDTRSPERKFAFTDLTNQLVDGVFARHLPAIHPLEVKQVSNDNLTTLSFSIGSRATSFKRPLLSVDVFVCLCVGNFDAKNILETKRFGGSCSMRTL